MSQVAPPERVTQNRVVQLFQKELGYTYLGDFQYRENNSNIEEQELTTFLQKKGYSTPQTNKAIYTLRTTASNFSDNLYNTNKNVYQLLRYGAQVKIEAGKNTETIHFIDWKNPTANHFAIAEEVTIKGNEHTKRPDIVIYINGIAVGVIELKRSKVGIGEGIRQNIVNQEDSFIQHFFATIQYVFAGNDTEGLRYGTIKTPEKFFLTWKEDIEDNSRLLLDKYLLKMCEKERFLEIINDFVVYDGGIKKLPRVHQYFGVKEAQKYINRYEGGIIWHTQGSGKSITMVYLAKWILENNPHARITIITDRDELDKQIESVFKGVGEKIYRTQSGSDLMYQLSQPSPRLLCSLVHKFGKKSKSGFNKFIKELEDNPPKTYGDVFVFVDECHRTQSGKLNRTMKAILPNAVFIGFTGTPLLKKDKQTSLEVFGKYIHTYKFNEGVNDRVILDLQYEARDIDQRITSHKNIDEWFELATNDLNDFQKAALKKKWGTMQKVLSSRSRMEKIVNDILLDFKRQPRLSSQMGNAILVADSIHEACKFYELFQKTPLKKKCAIVTSYNPQTRDIVTENIGENTETEKEFMYNLYKELLCSKSTEKYEDWAKEKFKNEPANMRLLIVVSKLLTGFDAPSCTYLYINKNMRDHGLFQAICRVNRLDTDDKQFGYIIDYKNLFEEVGNAIAVYTDELEYDKFEAKDIDILLKNRLKASKDRLENALEELHLLCEPVEPPKKDLEYIQYFCGNTEIPEQLKGKATQRTTLYKKTVALIRAYANIQDEMEQVGYNEKQAHKIKKEVDYYLNVREVVQNASNEKIDLKPYEADMRHLIDSYIQADESKKIAPFGNMPLIDVIVNSGIATAINSMSDGVKNNQQAIAETIENNVRSKIIKDRLTDPAFFDEMSKLLTELIKQRKNEAITYEEYLKKIAKIANDVNGGKSNETPKTLVTKAQRALYNNLEKNEKLAIQVDAAVKSALRDGWRGNLAKEREIKKALYVIFNDIDKVNEVFKIILEQKEDY